MPCYNSVTKIRRKIMFKSLKRKLLSGVLALTFAFSVLALPVNNLFNSTAKAENENAETEISNYYYNELSDQAKKFYVAIDSMNNDGLLKSGNGSYDLIASNVVTSNDVLDYGNGNGELLVEFGAAKDAYYLDHPEIFYVNFDLLTLSFATKNGNAIAAIDAGRTTSYYAEGFSSETAVNTAIQEIENQTSSAVSTIQSNINALKTEGNTSSDQKLTIQAINQYIVDNADYGFYSNTDDAKNHIRSIYGFFKYKLLVCEGFAKTFKYLCEQFSIECVEVVGYLFDNETNALEPHAWNSVKLENGFWYAVDCTLNNSNNADDYLFIGEETLAADHFEDGVISESNFSFSYPKLATYDYGKEELEVVVNYVPNDTGFDIVVKTSYDYKNAAELREEDLYIALNYIYSKNSNNEAVWGNPFVPLISALKQDFDGYSEYYLSDYIGFQFILTNSTNYKTTDSYLSYENGLSDSDIIAKSNIIYNEYYESSVPAFISTATFVPKNSTDQYNIGVLLPAEKTYDVTVVYSEALKIADSLTDIGLTISSEDFTDVSEYAKIENFNFDGDRTITFTFTPSQMYKHNYLTYDFTLVNILTQANDTVPYNLSVRVKRYTVVCNKILDNGRLYLDIYGSPTLIDNSDLSVAGWSYTDDNGTSHTAVENQRSQLALVVTKPSNSEQKSMEDGVSAIESSVLSSETYELELDLCGTIATIPNGSYVKVAFGFPEGYSYSSLDEGVTFKVYHFIKVNDAIDYDNPVEMEVVITEYGLVVQTSSFSPFMVVAVNSSSSNSKAIYARSINNFGTVASNNSNIVTLDDGSVEFTLSANSGYAIDYVLLNGEDVTSRVTNGKLTLTYEELNSNNTLDVAFAHEDVLAYEQENNIVNSNKSFNQNQIISEKQIIPSDGLKNPFNALYVVIPVLVVTFAVATVVGVYLVKKNRRA